MTKKEKENKEVKNKEKIDGFKVAKQVIATILLLALASGTLAGIYEIVMTIILNK